MDGRRWSSHQPNVTGRGIVAGYSARFWATVVVLGVVTGAIASGLAELLHLTEHIAYGYSRGPFLDGVTASVGWRHFAALMTAAAIVIVSGFVLGRPRGGPEATEVSASLWLSEGRLPLVSSIVRGVLAIVTVGLGSSMGREGAPQLAGAGVASWLSELDGLPVWQRRLLVASGAGAGFAAIYNVPLGGALFALEVLLGTVSLPFVLPALATSVIATAVAWITLGTHPTYDLPHYLLHPGQQMVFALLAGPLIGIAAVGWVRLVKLASRVRPKTTRARIIAPIVVFAALAAVSLKYPELLGNGKGVVQQEALGGYTLGLLVVLLALKPLATAGCLGAGSPGGLFTPSLTIGVLLAGVLGTVFNDVWSGAPIGSYAVIGGAAFLAAAMQGPLSGVVLMLELTRNFDSLMAPTLLAVAEATVIARKLGAPSIYSARLRPDPDALSARSAGAAAINTLDRAGVPAPSDDEDDDE
jgi:chloride channel protein, CIC family